MTRPNGTHDRDQSTRMTPGATYPVAVPAGSGSALGSSQVSASIRDLEDTSTSTLREPKYCSTVRARGRLGHRQLERLSTQLSERDFAILTQVGQHRFLTTHQIQRFALDRHATTSTAERVCRRVVARLRRLGLLASLPQRVGGVRGGSSATIWHLTNAGLRLTINPDSRTRPRQPSQRFLEHCLAVADTHITLRDLARYENIRQVGVQVEPGCWRRYTGTGGEAHWLQPDLAVTVRGNDEDGSFEDRWFVEVDRGTESMSTLLRKCAQYEAYRATGIEQAERDVFPLVLWLMQGRTAQQRARELSRRIAASQRYSRDLYRIVTTEHLTEVVLTGAAS